MGNLAGWPWWKVISLTGQAGAGTDYQVELEIGDSAGGQFHLGGRCTNFPQDIRITDDDGTTLLDHFVLDLTADPIVVKIEVKDDLGSNRDIRIYYGKSGETSASNGANTFIRYHGSASANFIDTLDYSLASMIYEVKAKVTSDTHNINWGMSNLQDNTDDFIYIQSYSPDNDRYVQVANENSKTYKNENPKLVTNQWYRGKIIYDGTSLYAYFDSNQIGTGAITTNLPNEDMGLNMYLYDGTGEQTWSFIRKYNSPEPAFSSAGVEQSAAGAPTGVFYGPFVGPFGGSI